MSPQQPPLDPGVADHLQLSAFKGKFDVADFVGAVSEKLISQSKADNGPFDPKPFIQTFEAAVDRLIQVRRDVQAKTEQMEKSVRVAEREYSKKMADLNQGFEAIGSTFTGMESRMNEVASIAVRIGEQLETVHVERQRAQAAYDLIYFYNQFTKGDTTRLDAMRKEGRAGRRQVAILLRRLSIVAREVDLPTTDRTREAIEKYCEKFEKEMLNLFDRCYRRGDPKMMHHCAQTLLEFNGGASCVQVYVNQHDFFINSVRDAAPSEDIFLWSVLPDPNASAPKTEKGLSQLFSEIRATVDTEAQIVKAVFPNPPVVMQVFLQRVFAQSIQQHMEQLLHRANGISDLAYLRVLQLVHSQTSALVDDLKTYELPNASPRTPTEVSEFRRSLSGSTAISSGPVSSVVTMLETAMDELFVPYTEGQRYLERESKNLGTLYATLLSNFTRYHERTQKGKSSMFDRMVNQLSAAAANSSAGSTTSAQAAAALMRFGGINADRNQDKPGEEPVKEEDGLLNVGVAEDILKWHAEAMGRCIELTPVDQAKNAYALLRVLTEIISTGYLEVALETAQARLEAVDKTDAAAQALNTLHLVDLIAHLWQQYISTTILPLASSSLTTRREIVNYNNQCVSRIETAANALLHRTMDSIMSSLSLQLAKQKRNDFKPRNEHTSIDRMNTESCISCCDILERVRDLAVQNLSGKNLEVFFTEIGVAFLNLLLEHLKKFPVSASGGLLLTTDLQSYQDVVNSFGIPALRERFEFLRQLGNLFLVRPDALKAFIAENHLSRIDPVLLKPYLALRSDWGDFDKGFIDGGEGDMANTQSKGIKDRFGRLSVMMKELEGLKISEGISVGLPTMPTGFTSGFSLSTPRPF